MRSKTMRRKAWLSVALCAGLLAAACGDDEEDGGDDGGEATADGDFSGETIQISGSSTVEPISSLVAEDFGTETGANVNVDGPGTGDGFELFCDGETDISDASRAITEEEIAVCDGNGIEYVEIQVAFDGMAVMTSPNNDDAPECLNFADLYAMVSAEAEGFENWSDGQEIASDLGSETELPDVPLELVGPGPESGTYDSFIEIALEGIGEDERGQDEVTTRTDYSQNADDNQIISGITSSDTSLGWVGFAFAQEVGDQVTTIPVAAEPGGDCVEPSIETISDGSYPLSRPLFIYVNNAKAEESEALTAFVDFYLEGLNSFVEEALYVPMQDAEVQASVDAWENR